MEDDNRSLEGSLQASVCFSAEDGEDNILPWAPAAHQLPADDPTFTTMDVDDSRLHFQAIHGIVLQEPQPERPIKEWSRVKRKRLCVSGSILILTLILATIGILVALAATGKKVSPSSISDLLQPARPPVTSSPSYSPSAVPTTLPSQVPSTSPSTHPSTAQPTVVPSGAPSELSTQVTTFYAIGDVPYTPQQATELAIQMQNIPDDIEFVIHVGDLRNATGDTNCRQRDYSDVASIFRLSPVPVFVILGDNDWTDCPNRDQGWNYWQEEFNGFEGMHWNHTFAIVRQPGRTENFAFVHKRTLFIGLNIVGGSVHDSDEWETRLSEQVDWTISLIREYHSVGPDASVVIFGHADPTSSHDAFFDPFTDFVADELQNELPILYVNGDKHEWLHEPDFFDQRSFLRLMLTGGTSEPPLRVSVVNKASRDTADVFPFDRQIS